MKRKYIIILTIVIVLFAGLFAFGTYNRWHYKKYEANIEKNRDVMKYFVNDNEEYVRIAFNRLESEFENPNDFKLDAFSVRKRDTVFNGNQDTIYNIYFTYFLINKNDDKFFSKVSVFGGTPTLQLYNLDARESSEYLRIKTEKEKLNERQCNQSKKHFNKCLIRQGGQLLILLRNPLTIEAQAANMEFGKIPASK